MRVDGARLHLGRVPPHLLEQRLARAYAPARLDEELEEAEKVAPVKLKEKRYETLYDPKKRKTFLDTITKDIKSLDSLKDELAKIQKPS